MGWTGVPYDKYDDKYKIIEQAIGIGNEDFGYSIAAKGRVGNTFYYAIKIPKDKVKTLEYIPMEDGSVVYGLTVLTSVRKDGSWGREFLYKFVDEFCGPISKECPQKVLKALSSLTQDYIDRDRSWAHEWRRDCWNYHNERRLHNKTIKTGNRLKAIIDLPYKSMWGEDMTIKKGSIVNVISKSRIKLNNRYYSMPSNAHKKFEVIN